MFIACLLLHGCVDLGHLPVQCREAPALADLLFDATGLDLKAGPAAWVCGRGRVSSRESQCFIGITISDSEYWAQPSSVLNGVEGEGGLAFWEANSRYGPVAVACECPLLADSGRFTTYS